MATIRTIELVATDKAGMTLDELDRFVQEARTAGMHGDSQPTAVIKIGSARIKKIEIKG